MKRVFLVVIIGLIALSVLAVVYIWDHQAMEKATQGEGNGRFYQMKRDNVAIGAAFNQLYGGPDHLDHGADGGDKGVSGPAWKDRFEQMIDNCVRAIKNSPEAFGHLTHPHRRLAPPGVYFTLLYFSVPTPFGVTGIRAGTQVVCVKEDGAVLLVKTGNLEFEAKRQYLTNDLDIADLASTNDAQSQEAVASSIAEDQAIYKARRDKENAAFEQRQQEIEAERAAEAKASRYDNPLERGPYGTPRP